MTDRISNDNNEEASAVLKVSPDAHGQAALLLVESLIHGLIGRSIISVEAAMEIVEVAANVKEEVAAEWGDSPETLHKSLGLLRKIYLSLSTDLVDGSATIHPIS